MFIYYNFFDYSKECVNFMKVKVRAISGQIDVSDRYDFYRPEPVHLLPYLQVHGARCTKDYVSK